MKIIKTMMAICVTVLSMNVAAIANPNSNAAPFGMELGHATLDMVRSSLGNKTDLKNEGTNKYTYGPMLSSDGSGLGIDGLSKVVFIFSKSDVLQGVIMTMVHNAMNHDAENVFNILSRKYSVISNNIDSFMDNGSARLSEGDSIIVVEAPGMSFSMDISYVTKELDRSFNASEADQKRQHQKSEQNSF